MALPAEGRSGRAPAWPLVPKASARERVLWDRLWRSPQAVMWELYGQELEVAMHVRTWVEAEVPGATAALRTLVRQQRDSLGLTLLSMRQFKWRVVEAVPASVSPLPRSSGRDRLAELRGKKEDMRQKMLELESPPGSAG